MRETDFLPETVLQILHEHVLRPDARIRVVKQHTLNALHAATGAMWPVLGPVLDRLVQALHDSPDLVVLGFFLVVLLIVLQMLSWISRAMMFWTRLAFRLLFWSAVVAAVAVVWQRGIGTTIGDVVNIGGKLMGYAVIVKDIWVREYQKYEAQAKSHGGPSGYKLGASRGR